MKEINLIPYEIRLRRQKKAYLIQVVAVAAIVAFILAVIAYYPYARLKSLNLEEMKLKTQIETENKNKAQDEKLKMNMTSMKDYIDKVESMKKNKVEIYPVLNNLQRYLPGDVIVTKLSFDNGNISIDAGCKNYDSIAEFLANLQESKEFRDTSINNINGAGGGNANGSGYTFTLNIVEAKVDTK